MKFSSLTLLISASQPAAKAQSEKATLEGCRPRLETERGNHGELQQWSWLKQTPVYVPLYLPLCAHTPHVKPSDVCTAALTCQSQLGEGQQPLTKPPSQCMQGRVLKKTCKKVLDLRGVLAECEKVLKALCVAWSGKQSVRGECLWGCKKGWAGDVSVGGTEGKKGKWMQGMSEQCRSGMRVDHCCRVGGSNLLPGIDKGGKAAQGWR